MSYWYNIYYFPRVNLYHSDVGVYAQALAYSGATFTFYVGDTLGM